MDPLKKLGGFLVYMMDLKKGIVKGKNMLVKAASVAPACAAPHYGGRQRGYF